MKHVAFILLVAAGLAAGHGGTVRGRVVDRKTSEPLPGVNVMLQGTLRGTVTSPQGEFLFRSVPPGRYALALSLVGYQRLTSAPFDLAADSGVDLAFELIAVPIQTEPVVVTASRREESLLEAPASVAVLDAAGIAFRNSVTMDDALRYVPGVNMTEFQVNIRGSSGYSRGVGSRVLLLVDGIPLMTGDTGEINYETIPVGSIERIEVLKGASSALYGSSALGGVINIITKRIPEEAETRIKAYGGVYGDPSYSQWDWKGGTRFLDGLSVSHSRRFDDLGVYASGSRMANDGYRQNDYLRRYNGALRMTYDVTSFDRVTFACNYLYQKRGNFLYWKDLAHALVPPAEQLEDKVESRRFYLSGIYTHTFSPSLLYSVRGLWFRNHFTDTVGPARDDSRSDMLHGEVQVSWIPVPSHILTGGAGGTRNAVNATLFGDRTGNGLAVYAQDEILIADDVRLTLGARYDVQKLDSLAVSKQFNPKAAIVYTPVPGTAVRLSVGRGFRAPSVAEAFTTTRAAGILVVPNPSLKPERSTSYELGASQVVGDVALFDVAVFQSDFSNLIESGFNAQGQGQFNNVTDARVRGLEASAKLGLFERAWFIDLGYTYVSPKDRTTQEVLKYRPRHLLYASSIVRRGPLMLGSDVRYLSRVERVDEEFVNLGVIKDGDQRVPVTVVDLRFGYDFSGLAVPLVATLHVNNLLQYNYVELIGNVAPPRSFVLAVEARL